MLERHNEAVRFVLEEFVDRGLVGHILEDVRRQSHNRLQVVIEEVAFEPQLQLGNVLTRDAFIIQLEQFLADD